MNQITCSTAPIVAVFESAQPIRIIMINNEPWFVAADVCDALAIGNASLAVNGRADREGGGLDDDERGIATVNTPSGDQQMLVVNESGLYVLIFKSRKPEAKVFRKWVTSEVLPSIRKTGYYVAPVAEPEPQYEEDAAPISDAETERLKKMVGGIAYCLPTMSAIKVAAAIYGRIKQPLRIGRIDDLPAPYFDRTMQYLSRLCDDARQHNRKQSAADEAFLTKMLSGSEVAA